MNHKHLLAGVAAAAIMAAGNAYAGAHASVEDQVKANAAAIDALSKEVEALKAGNAGPAKGVKGVKLKVSGHVNRAVAFLSDNQGRSDITFVDNDASSTRVRWDASANVSSSVEVGTRLEMEMESNGSFNVVGAGNTANNAANTANNAQENTFFARHAYVYIQGGFGTLTTGQQGDATEGILHSSFNFASLADINPEHTNGARIDGGINNFLAFGDGGRQDSIRYDTPNFGGAKASISTRDSGDVTAALRYSGKVGGVGVLAAVGYQQNFDNPIVMGSMGVNLGVVAINAAASLQSNDVGEDDFYYWLSLAHKGNYVDMGATSIAVDFDVSAGRVTGANNNSSIGIGLVQSVAPGADAYASVRTLYGGNGVDNSIVGLMGMRVRF